jgi:glycosyltransferase involved in cell wall biosynthesis
MNVLMIGVDKTSIGGMLTVVENYQNSKEFCEITHLRYIATVIRANKWIKIKTFIKKIPVIINTIRKYKIDIVHVHMAERGSVLREGFVILLAKAMGAKTVIHMHGATIEDWYNRQSPVIKKIVKKIFCSADKMLVLGENWIPFMQRVMGKSRKIAVLHNAVEVPATNKYNIESTEVLFYGMLIQRKGIDDLLSAFESILNEIPKEVNLVMYGDDYDSHEKIQDKIKRYNLENRAFYKGWLTAENREDAYKNAILNVLPSYNEGLPMTILETMGHGIPNISTNIAAIPEAVMDGINGKLVMPGNVDGLADAMVTLINNKRLRVSYSQQAYNLAKDEYSLSHHFESLIGIYEELL